MKGHSSMNTATKFSHRVVTPLVSSLCFIALSLLSMKPVDAVMPKVESIAFSPDGKKVATAYWSGGGTHNAQIWDVDSGRLLQTLRHADDVESVAFSPDGEKVVTGTYDPRGDNIIFQIWDANSGKLLQTQRSANKPETAIFSSGGKKIVIPPYPSNAETQIVDAKSGRVLRTLQGHADGAVSSAALSADGKKAATADGDCVVRIWDAESGIILRHWIVGQSQVRQPTIRESQPPSRQPRITPRVPPVRIAI